MEQAAAARMFTMFTVTARNSASADGVRESLACPDDPKEPCPNARRAGDGAKRLL
jgi:hypothetical protein